MKYVVRKFVIIIVLILANLSLYAAPSTVRIFNRADGFVITHIIMLDKPSADLTSAEELAKEKSNPSIKYDHSILVPELGVKIKGVVELSEPISRGYSNDFVINDDGVRSIAVFGKAPLQDSISAIKLARLLEYIEGGLVVEGFSVEALSNSFLYDYFGTVSLDSLAHSSDGAQWGDFSIKVTFVRKETINVWNALNKPLTSR